MSLRAFGGQSRSAAGGSPVPPACGRRHHCLGASTACELAYIATTTTSSAGQRADGLPSAAPAKTCSRVSCQRAYIIRATRAVTPFDRDFSVARTSLERRIRHGSSRGTCGCLTRFAARSTQRLTARLRRSIAFNKYRHDPSAGRTLSFGWRRYAQLSFLDPKRKIYGDPGAHPGMVLRCPGVNARRWVIADWIPCRAKKEQPSSANRSSM